MSEQETNIDSSIESAHRITKKNGIKRDSTTQITEECQTPKRVREHAELKDAENHIQVVDLAKSPKKRKQDIGDTPYSPSRTPIKGSILDIQIGKRSLNSPLPSPKPYVVVTPPQSPLRGFVKRANEIYQNRSNQSTTADSDKSNEILSDKNSKNLSVSSPLKTMLSSSNSSTILNFVKSGKLITSFTDALLQTDSKTSTSIPQKKTSGGGRILFPDNS